MIVSVVISFVIFGFAAGVLWIFVFGDDPWPASVNTIFPILFAVVFLTVWIACVRIGYVIGKRLEQDPILNQKHVLISAGITLLSMLFIVFQQWGVGNLGPKSEGEICSDFCSQQGYSASNMPPLDSGERSCSCFADSGLEAIKVPMHSIDPLK